MELNSATYSSAFVVRQGLSTAQLLLLLLLTKGVYR